MGESCVSGAGNLSKFLTPNPVDMNSERNKRFSSMSMSMPAPGGPRQVKGNTQGQGGFTSPKELPFLSAMELIVFQTAINNYKIHGQFLRNDGLSLYWVFGAQIMQVLEMVEEDYGTVMKSSTSDKIVVKVYGKSGGGEEVYWIPPGKSICQCIAYQRAIKRDYCKHVLVAHFLLAIAPPQEYKLISEQDLISLFKTHIKSPHNKFN